jgi:hypothetical protein
VRLIASLGRLIESMRCMFDGCNRRFELQKNAFEKRKDEGGEKALARVCEGLGKAIDSGFGSAGKEVVTLYRERFRLVKEVQAEIVKGKGGSGDEILAIDGKIREAIKRVRSKLTVQ